MHVVVVDDEERIVTLLTRYLAERGITTTACHDGPSGLAAARRGDADAMVLDLMLPGLSGLEVCRTLRAEGNDLPVLLLTARGTLDERVAGLGEGADDYLVKPFALEEVHARLQAITRRRAPREDDHLRVGALVLDPDGHRLWVAGTETEVPRREFAMLRTLMESPGRAVSRDRLFDEVWDDDTDISSNALDVTVSRLRQRVEGGGVEIRTVRGVGYRLETTR
ncbi:response regulator transcription factor [Nocardioides marmoribigeumensis]|uniref:DNA-binding response OmpR family regulator n=1 Tax=Nocardioides marmoribigeumensis TaxID=433649 RepID=A0ABU2BYG9_9ACTN|nr:response regulator transcription factor [Nocardioides marmoribigeumensis]MDR7363455.1 DNA-binding response OmpR family regulator [Nocardioides marmoribigeumensis]